MYQRMFDHMGFGDYTVVINILVTKIVNNLKYWADYEDIIGKSLIYIFSFESYFLVNYPKKCLCYHPLFFWGGGIFL